MAAQHCQMRADTVAVLQEIARRPGITTTQLKEAFAGAQVNVENKVSNLLAGGYINSERVPGQKAVRLFVDEEFAEPVLRLHRPVRAQQTQGGPVVPPRQVQLDQPWHAPYMTGAYIRPGSLPGRQYPSRRGDRLYWPDGRVTPAGEVKP